MIDGKAHGHRRRDISGIAHLLEEGVDQDRVQESIRKENTRMLTERFADFEGSTFDTRLEALRDLHLHGHGLHFSL